MSHTPIYHHDNRLGATRHLLNPMVDPIVLTLKRDDSELNQSMSRPTLRWVFQLLEGIERACQVYQRPSG